MAMPCSSAALITSSSRSEPPGWITAVTASQKAGMALLVVFFVAGLALLTRVRETS